MNIQRRTVVYQGPGGPFEGVLAFDADATETRPGVMIVPNVLGQKEQDNLKAEQLAKLGYVGFACDVFGQGKRAKRSEPDMKRYMDELSADRALLRDRLHASLAAFTACDEVDAKRVAAIGFCFGGKCVLDLARSGAKVRGVISFHGLYDPPDYASTLPIQSKILVCHGWEDPLSLPDATVALARELTEAKADWQLWAQGHAGHAFTDETLQKPGEKVAYHADADRRSWALAQNFFTEIFAD